MEKKIKLQDWQNKAKKLFGGNPFNWKYKCPNCGNIQTAEDFRNYKDKGATLESAFSECIGRYIDNCKGKLGNKKSPCNYASYGLFKLSNTIVISEDNKEINVFDFYEDLGGLGDE